MGVEPFLVASSLTAASRSGWCAARAPTAPSRTSRGRDPRPARPARRGPGRRHARCRAPAAPTAAAPATAAAPPSTRCSRSTPRCADPADHADRGRRRRARPGRRPGHAARLGAGEGLARARPPSRRPCGSPTPTTRAGTPARPATAASDHDMLACPWCACPLGPDGCATCHRPGAGLEDLPLVLRPAGTRGTGQPPVASLRPAGAGRAAARPAWACRCPAGPSAGRGPGPAAARGGGDRRHDLPWTHARPHARRPARGPVARARPRDPPPDHRARHGQVGRGRRGRRRRRRDLPDRRRLPDEGPR